MPTQSKPASSVQDPIAQKIEEKEAAGREAYKKLDPKSQKQVDTLVLQGLESRIAGLKACEISTAREEAYIQDALLLKKNTVIAAERGKIIESRAYKHVTIDPRLVNFSLNSGMFKPHNIEAAPRCMIPR